MVAKEHRPFIKQGAVRMSHPGPRVSRRRPWRAHSAEGDATIDRVDAGWHPGTRRRQVDSHGAERGRMRDRSAPATMRLLGARRTALIEDIHPRPPGSPTVAARRRQERNDSADGRPVIATCASRRPRCLIDEIRQVVRAGRQDWWPRWSRTLTLSESSRTTSAPGSNSTPQADRDGSRLPMCTGRTSGR